jgi:hypothetical protein
LFVSVPHVRHIQTWQLSIGRETVPTERPEDQLRRVVREELNDWANDLDIGSPGSDRRRQWLYMIRRVEEQIKRQDAAKDRRVSSLAGIGYGVISTLVGVLLAKLVGGFEWLANFFTGRP